MVRILRFSLNARFLPEQTDRSKEAWLCTVRKALEEIDLTAAPFARLSALLPLSGQ